MPGFDVVGFEYKSERDKDLKKVENALTLLSNYKNMIKRSGAVECEHIESKSKVIYEGKELKNY